MPIQLRVRKALAAPLRPLPTLLVILVVAATFAAPVNAQGYGTDAAATAAAVRALQPRTSVTVPPAPSGVFDQAAAVTGGVGLRNRKSGFINISGLTGAPTAAYLYWAVITQGPAPVSSYAVFVRRADQLVPTLVSGIVVGVGPQPCWIGNRITVFKAVVPLTIATGNDSYQVIPFPGNPGTTDGSDPWTTAVLPLWEGASMVMVGPGSNRVVLYDLGLAGTTFSLPLNYILSLPPGGSPTGTFAQWDNIGADGQTGISLSAIASLSDETTTINGIPVAGTGSPYHDSDWNGSSGFPLPELWDDTGHLITAAVPAGTSTLNVSMTTTSDCLTAVANVLQYPIVQDTAGK